MISVVNQDASVTKALTWRWALENRIEDNIHEIIQLLSKRNDVNKSTKEMFRDFLISCEWNIRDKAIDRIFSKKASDSHFWKFVYMNTKLEEKEDFLIRWITNIPYDFEARKIALELHLNTHFIRNL